MKKNFILLFFFLFIGCSETLPPPSTQTINLIEKELSRWGDSDDASEARWPNYKVGYNKTEGNLYIQVAAQPLANDIAMNGYINIIKDIHSKYAKEYNLVGRVYQMGEQKKTCYVNGSKN